MDPCAQATPRRGLQPNVAAVTARHVAGNGQAKADAAGAKRFAPYLRLYLAGNPLTDTAKSTQLEALKAAGVRIEG